MVEKSRIETRRGESSIFPRTGIDELSAVRGKKAKKKTRKIETIEGQSVSVLPLVSSVLSRGKRFVLSRLVLHPKGARFSAIYIEGGLLLRSNMIAAARFLVPTHRRVTRAR